MCFPPLAALSGGGGGRGRGRHVRIHPARTPTNTHLSHSLTHTLCCVQTRAAIDFADDPFKDYRYEDPFNIEDPFSDVTDSKPKVPESLARPTSVAGFETDDFFASNTLNGFKQPEKRSGRVSAPPVSTSDPFSSRPTAPPSDWAAPAWPDDNWAAEDAWAKPTNNDAWGGKNNTNSDWKTDNWTNKSDAWANKTDNWNTNKSDNLTSKSDDWATDWSTDRNKNLNETWPNTSTLPTKKEKSPKPVKYAKSLVHTIGGIGRTRQKDKKAKAAQLEAKGSELLPTEEQQWAWAAAESKRLEVEAEKRRRQEDAELQLALAISRQEK